MAKQLLKAYSEYKPSNAEWLGDIPVDWKVYPTKRLFRHVTEEAPKNNKMELLSVYTEIGVKPRKDLEARGNKATTTDGYWLVEKGDIVVNKLLAWMGAIGISEYEGVTSPAYDILRKTRPLNPYYYNYLLRTPYTHQELKKYSKGIMEVRLRLYFTEFGRIHLPYPPLETQNKIVNYLNHKTQQAERFIEKQTHLIELLEEQKKTIIYTSITQGIDTKVPMITSTIDGIEFIPKHWDIIRLGRVINLITGYPFKSSGFSTNKSDIPLLRGINVTPKKIRWDDTVYWKRKVRDGLEKYALKTGDVVLGMDRPVVKAGVRVATITHNDVPSLLLQRVACIHPTKKIDGGFLLLLITSGLFESYIAPIFTGISVPHLSPEQINNFKIALPPEKEQQAIKKYIVEQNKRIDCLIKQAKSEIKLTKEYLNSLIYQVVTGQVEVKE